MLRFDCPACLCSCHLAPEKLPPGTRARVACPSCHDFLVLRRRFSGDVICELEQPMPERTVTMPFQPPPLPNDAFFPPQDAPPPLPDDASMAAHLQPPPIPDEPLVRQALVPPPPQEEMTQVLRLPQPRPTPPALPLQPTTADLVRDFSVLFRLDRRSKRQEHMIAVMGLVVLLMVATLGVWVGPSLLAGVPFSRGTPVVAAIPVPAPLQSSAFERSQSVVELALETVASARLPAAQLAASAPAAAQIAPKAVAPVVVADAKPAAKADTQLAQGDKPVVRRVRPAPRVHEALRIRPLPAFLPPDDEVVPAAAGPRTPSAPSAPVDDLMK